MMLIKGADENPPIFSLTNAATDVLTAWAATKGGQISALEENLPLKSAKTESQPQSSHKEN